MNFKKILFTSALLLSALFVGCEDMSSPTGSKSSKSAVAKTPNESELVGTWAKEQSGVKDTMIIREDGTMTYIMNTMGNSNSVEYDWTLDDNEFTYTSIPFYVSLKGDELSIYVDQAMTPGGALVYTKVTADDDGKSGDGNIDDSNKKDTTPTTPTESDIIDTWESSDGLNYIFNSDNTIDTEFEGSLYANIGQWELNSDLFIMAFEWGEPESLYVVLKGDTLFLEYDQASTTSDFYMVRESSGGNSGTGSGTGGNETINLLNVLTSESDWSRNSGYGEATVMMDGGEMWVELMRESKPDPSEWPYAYLVGNIDARGSMRNLEKVIITYAVRSFSNPEGYDDDGIKVGAGLSLGIISEFDNGISEAGWAKFHAVLTNGIKNLQEIVTDTLYLENFQISWESDYYPEGTTLADYEAGEYLETCNSVVFDIASDLWEREQSIDFVVYDIELIGEVGLVNDLGL